MGSTSSKTVILNVPIKGKKAVREYEIEIPIGKSQKVLYFENDLPVSSGDQFNLVANTTDSGSLQATILLSLWMKNFNAYQIAVGNLQRSSEPANFFRRKNQLPHFQNNHSVGSYRLSTVLLVINFSSFLRCEKYKFCLETWQYCNTISRFYNFFL